MTSASPNPADAPRQGAEAPDQLDAQSLDPRLGVQGATDQQGNGSRQGDGAHANSSSNPAWPYELEGAEFNDTGSQVNAPTAPRGPGFRDRLGNTLMPVRHHVGAARAAVLGEAGTRYQRHLEQRRPELEAARRETIGAWAAQGLVAHWQGFNNRREALGAIVRDIRQQWAAHRLENMLNREHRRGNTRINWEALGVSRPASSSSRTSERQNSNQQPSNAGDAARGSQNPRNADARATGRADRRRQPANQDDAQVRREPPALTPAHADEDIQKMSRGGQQPERALIVRKEDGALTKQDARGTHNQRTDRSQGTDREGNQERKSGRASIDDKALAIAAWEYGKLPQAEQEANDMQQWVANRAAALAIAAWEYGKLPQAEQEANDMQQWVANRASVLPKTEWGNVAVARKMQYLLGHTEQEYETVAWNELGAEPYLLRTGMTPAAWVEARAAWLKYQAIAGDDQIAQVRAEARRTAEESAAKRRAEQEYERKVAAQAAPIANILHAQLRTPEVKFDPGMDGNRIRRARDHAEWLLSEIVTDRERRNLPNPFHDPRRSASQNTRNFLHALNALTYVIAELGLTTKRVNPTPAEAKIVSEATFRAVEEEVFNQL